MVIDKVSDIGFDDPVIRDVATQAKLFGLEDMLEVCLQLESFAPGKADQLLFLVTDENAAEAIATLLALAVVNYATWKHEEFFVNHPLMDQYPPIRLYRIQKEDTHKADGDRYFAQAKVLIEKFFPEG